MANKLRSQIPDSTSTPEPEEVKEQPKERISQKASKEASKEKKEAKAEKSESTNSKKLDARFIKISGLLLVLVSLYLFIAFFSYLFTWKEDQSVVSNASFNIIFDAANHKVENWLGIIGAMVSHLFMYRGFGLASFLFVLASFLIGYRLLFKVS
jgi:S-DNA-T family DNA segregation ATPase FtsK/SpoIIIE